MTANPKSAVATGLKRPLVRIVVAVAAAAAIVVSMLMWQTPSASAHCDSATGPVVTAARDALEAGDVNLILPYVQPEYEQELTAAFNQTLNIRKRGPEVREVADQYFFETAVRLHRVGEGASYTGIKTEVEESPALEAAERALQAGNPDEAISLLDDEVQAGVTEHFQHVLEAREAEEENPTVETARERVEAEFAFQKYVLGISDAIHGSAHEEAGPGDAGHGH